MQRETKKDLSGYFRMMRPVSPIATMLGLGHQDQWNSRTRVQEEELLSTVRRIVGSRYLLQDMKLDDTGIFAKVLVQPDENPKMFEEVRLELKEHNLYPRLAKVDKQHIIAIYPKPKRKPSSYTANIIMFALTLVTTVWAGAILWGSRSGGFEATDLFLVLLDPVSVGLGALTFALPLILILGSHELGHYFTSRAYKVDASLPYFIPIPPIISPFGTFGALISMKENLSNRKALVDIGAAGPIAGFIVAIPVTIIGLLLTDAYPARMADLVDGDTYLIINPPLAFNLLSSALGVGSDGVIYPTALAGWIGLFVTALNLFPVGQLDGGHIVRGMFGANARFISYATVAIMVFLGFTTGFTTYLFFAVLILILGARHPPPLDDISPIRPRQVGVFVAAVIMMALSFHPVPLEQVQFREGNIGLFPNHDSIVVDPTLPGIFAVTVLNEGSIKESVDLSVWYLDGKVLPELIGDPPEAVARIADGGTVHATFDMGTFSLYLLDPLGRDLPRDSEATWRIVSLGTVEAQNGSFTLSFTTESGLEEDLEVPMTRLSSGIVLDRTRIGPDEMAQVKGRLIVLDHPGGPIDLNISYRFPSEGYRVFLTPGNGTASWLYPMMGSSLDISPSGDVGYTLSLEAAPGMVVAHFLIEPFHSDEGRSRLEISLMSGDLGTKLVLAGS